jgi:hypothetical protein
MITHEIQPPRIRVIDPDPNALPKHALALFRFSGIPIKAFYRCQEAARFLGVSRSQIYYMIDDGRISPVQFPPSPKRPNGKTRPTLIPITTLLSLIPPAASAD